MRVAILGSGVIGVTSAYYLAKAGYSVSVFDRCPDSAQETSYANGAQLSYSHAAPWAEPAVLPKILQWFGDNQAPLVFRFRPEWDLYRWGLSFLRHCTVAKNQRGTADIWRLSSYSRSILHDFLAQEPIEFDYTKKGILHIFKNKKEWHDNIKKAEFLSSLGSEYTAMDRQACLAHEPILEQSHSSIAGGIHYTMDEVGNIFTFTQKLVDICKKQGVEFHYNTIIESLQRDAQKITTIKTSKGEFEFDAYVVALSAYSGLLVKPLGLYLPIYPLKGYTLTIPIPHGSGLPLPQASITDQASKIVYTRLGQSLRVAGTAEIAGFNTDLHKERIQLMHNQTAAMFPMYQTLFADNHAVQEWACLRSSTPSGLPIIGKTPYSNLFLNTGHGSLGWTMAMGSAKILHDIILNNPTEIPADSYSLF